MFLAVYVPAFVAVALIRPPVQIAVPLIIGVSVAVALTLIFTLARGLAGIRQFGFSIPHARYLGWAVALGAPLALAAGALGHMFPSSSPIDTSKLPLWMLALFFGVGAPIQEEIIFRGLLQSFLEERWKLTLAMARMQLSAAVVFVALLFGLVHLESGTAVAAGAIVLGLAAGELRRRSSSVIPAVMAHALFNVVALLWP
jgi:hypothetical protein